MPAHSLLVKTAFKKISLTPLIDVVFILLLFFMLTTQFIKHQQLGVEAPTNSSGASTQDKVQALILHSDERLSLDSAEAAAARDFEQVVTELDPEQPVILYPKGNTNAQQIVSALDKIKRSQITQYSLGAVVE